MPFPLYELKVNITKWLEFELANYNVAVQNLSYYPIGTLPYVNVYALVCVRASVYEYVFMSVCVRAYKCVWYRP